MNMDIEPLSLNTQRCQHNLPPSALAQTYTKTLLPFCIHPAAATNKPWEVLNALFFLFFFMRPIGLGDSEMWI